MNADDSPDGHGDDALPAFEELMALHRADPAAFEQLRARLLGKAIDAAPEKHRRSLSALVEQLNAARAVAPSERAAAEAAFRLMQQSVARLSEAMEQAREEIARLQATVLLKQISLNASLERALPARRVRRHRDRM